MMADTGSSANSGIILLMQETYVSPKILLVRVLSLGHYEIDIKRNAIQ